MQVGRYEKLQGRYGNGLSLVYLTEKPRRSIFISRRNTRRVTQQSRLNEPRLLRYVLGVFDCKK